jgi:hypothetical protein
MPNEMDLHFNASAAGEIWLKFKSNYYSHWNYLYVADDSFNF